MEVLNKQEDHTLYFGVNLEKYPKPVSYKFNSGLNQKFPDEASILNFDLFIEDISLSELHNIYPIIITIKPELSNCYPYESSFLRLEGENNIWKPLLIAQKIHFENSSYFLNEIYGLSVTDLDGHDCIICLTHKSTVTLLPCKHLCLCEGCAKLLDESSVKKCPIDRTGIIYLEVKELLYISE